MLRSSRPNSPPLLSRTRRFLPILTVTLLLATSLSCRSTDHREADAEPSAEVLARFEAANDRFEEGDVAGAAEEYRTLLAEPIPPATWGKITFNLGLAYASLGDVDASVQAFATIFDSAVDDREPGGSLMEEFRNYRYWASFEISRVLAEAGRLEEARAAVRSCREDYPYQAHCATCGESARAELASWEAELDSRIGDER